MNTEHWTLKSQVVLFKPPLESSKEIMVNCLKEIVENTQKFPRWSLSLIMMTIEMDVNMIIVQLRQKDW